MVASNSKIDAMRFAMACIKHNPKRRVLFVCSVQDKYEYLSLIEDCLMVEKIVKHSGKVYLKNATHVADHRSCFNTTVVVERKRWRVGVYITLRSSLTNPT